MKKQNEVKCKTCGKVIGDHIGFHAKGSETYTLCYSCATNQPDCTDPQPTDEKIREALKSSGLNTYCSVCRVHFTNGYKMQLPKLKEQAEEIMFLGNALDAEVINRDNANRALADKEEEIEKLNNCIDYMRSDNLRNKVQNVKLSALLSEAVHLLKNIPIPSVDHPIAKFIDKYSQEQFTKENEG